MDPKTVTASIPIKLESGEADDNQASQTTEQPSTMANEENERNQLKLNLNHSTRKQLFTILNDLPLILQYNQPIPADAKQRTSKKIDDLILVLANLSPFGPRSSSDDSDVFEVRIADQLTVDLSRAERSRIVSHLIDLKDAVLSSDLFTVETKRCLIAENKRMVVRLLDLPVRMQSDDDLLFNDANEDNDEPVSKKQRSRSSSVTGSQGGRTTGLVVRLNKPKSENDPMRVIKNVNAEASFKFELCEVSKFFETGANERSSDTFWCSDLPWSLKVKINPRTDGSRFLGFYLDCRHDEPQDWSCKVECDLILFSRLPTNENKVHGFKFIFKRPGSHGLLRFISYRELMNESNSFIKDDKIVLGIELKAGPVIRK